MNGILMSVKERHEQINKHGYTLEQDRVNKYYKNGELKQAALFFLTGEHKYYPKSWDQKYKQKRDKKTEIQQMVIAAALLMAEIDRKTKSVIALPDLQLRRAEYKKGLDQFYYVILAKNGQVLATSETYTRRASARRACNRLNESIGSYLLITDATDRYIPFPKLLKTA